MIQYQIKIYSIIYYEDYQQIDQLQFQHNTLFFKSLIQFFLYIRFKLRSLAIHIIYYLDIKKNFKYSSKYK